MMSGDDMSAAPVDDSELRRAGALLRGALPASEFTDGFADRTMARVISARNATQPAVLRYSALQHNFRTLAAAAAVAIFALGVHNTLIVRVSDTSLVEAAIGLQPVSAESILSSASEGLE